MKPIDDPRALRSAETDAIVSVSRLNKTYASGFQALRDVDLTIRRGEIFALLGPNGAGKTTLIGIICGLVKPTSGTIVADGHDIVRDYRAARAKIGLVRRNSTPTPSRPSGTPPGSAAASSARSPTRPISRRS